MDENVRLHKKMQGLRVTVPQKSIKAGTLIASDKKDQILLVDYFTILRQETLLQHYNDALIEKVAKFNFLLAKNMVCFFEDLKTAPNIIFKTNYNVNDTLTTELRNTLSLKRNSVIISTLSKSSMMKNALLRAVKNNIDIFETSMDLTNPEVMDIYNSLKNIKENLLNDKYDLSTIQRKSTVTSSKSVF